MIRKQQRKNRLARFVIGINHRSGDDGVHGLAIVVVPGIATAPVSLLMTIIGITVV